ncbi:helix-turn-helix transcriptional regulator [Francisella adeliensis]|uniref:HTH luxR-type domain-containing protein n=1 Tax=Francisella adeliensis TaxID=2007306 RepID=A0A2Z4Y0G4_9GAMM|nr:LuxR C-terminal-related transcriptional regulator [Francisella adeliensis]AXA34368.1 hypothetical protein CDH04_08150 [Francisella adeliensis]MBK2086455.1 hypothetical protein [Francisella adeliensis]MBK2096083.1 hypothetical protein [Francisella adeliensis]QIW12615.1 hypothetical protein FZC43_08155 [Francisella adeliensis]QIW14488.1 hypothetical protein FZC44_08150 [Francisella adeliensis]
MNMAYIYINQDLKIVDSNDHYKRLNIDSNTLIKSLCLNTLKEKKKQYSSNYFSNHYCTLRFDLISTTRSLYWITIRIINIEDFANINTAQIVEALNGLPLYIYAKDSNGTYAFCNDHKNFLANNPINKTDHDLQWVSSAQKLINNDQFTLESMSQQYFIEQINIDNKIISSISIKTPENQILFGLSIELNHIHQKMLEYSNNIIIGDNSDIKFSTGEMECMYWSVEGKSAAEIATIINKSKKTIEWNINQIRKKLNCQRTSKLAYMLGRYHAHLINEVK